VSARLAAAAGVLLAAVVGLTGCGSDHGQANALAACHLYSSAKAGGLSASALTAKLTEAARFAGKASKQSAQWDTLQSSLAQLVAASRAAATPKPSTTALQDSAKVIDSSCAIAARGY